MQKNSTPRIWTEISEEPVALCKVFSIIKKTFRHPDGRTGDFFVNRSNDWVQIAPLVDSDNPADPLVLIVNQFRFGSKRTSWEFSGGIVEKGESPVDAAVRELAEETGYTCRNAKLLASYSPNPALHENSAHFVVAEGCEKTSETHWDANEEIETKLVRVSELYPMVKSGEIYHSIAINCVFSLEKYLAEKAAETR